jgi:proteasome lid subunit RPN8/RPN11
MARVTLKLPADLLDAMLAECRSRHPHEACGVLVGHDNRPLIHRAMANTHVQPASRFAFAAEEQLEVYRALDTLRLEPVVIYHSHPASPATPSGMDRLAAREPDAHYVIVSTRAEWPEVRSYALVAGELVEEPIEVRGPC